MMRRPVGLVLALASLACALVPAAAFGQVVEPPFDSSYSVRNLGQPPGVPSRLGGMTFMAGERNRLLIGGEANASTGALYSVPLGRGADGQITGFSGAATRFADAPNNDGGVAYAPDDVLFLAQWPNNDLGQTKPGSTVTDKVIDLDALGVASSVVGVGFVPPGFPGARSLKLNSYSGGQWYDAAVTPDGNGTWDITSVGEVPGSRLGGGADGFVYVPAGSRQFSAPSMLVSEYSAGMVAAYEVDSDGNPLPATRRTFISGLTGAVGAAIDPATDEFLFSTFGGDNRVVAVSGFGTSPAPPAPTLGETVTADVVQGEVLIRKGGRFVPLTEVRSIPVGSILDTRKGTVKLSSARDRKGKVQTGRFSAGVFQVLQSRRTREKGLTELRLKGSAAQFKRCRSTSSRAGVSRLSRRTIRRLRGNARGRYRTRGRHSAATVRGTAWTMRDRCDGTLTTVKRGKVAVRDFRRKKTVLVTAGKSYLAGAK
jgi:hypothetical protein